MSTDFKELSLSEDFDEVIFNCKAVYSPVKNKKNIKRKSTYKKNGVPIKYDHRTEEFYRVLRMRKMDPFTHMEVNDSYVFMYPYEWDPYTGETLDIDPYGPLCFDPEELTKYFYLNRLTKLWNEPVNEGHGYFLDGYYDDGVGAGEDFFVPGRGDHPEWYLFRLPIIDCYLTTDHKDHVITLGPRLSDEEVVNIDKLCQLKATYHRNKLYPRPSLLDIKKLYDTAISKDPFISAAELEGLTADDIAMKKAMINRQAVDKLRKMRAWF